MMPDRVDMVQRKRGRKTEAKAKTVDRTQKEANLDTPKSSNDSSPLNTVDLDSSPHDEMSVEMEILVEEHTVSVDMESLVEEHIHTVSVDIEGLVEECFLDINYSPGAGQRASVIYQGPVFEITFEEEFKIHELVVRKEFLQDSIFTLLFGVPFINSCISSFILTGRKPKDKILTKKFSLGLSQVFHD